MFVSYCIKDVEIFCNHVLYPTKSIKGIAHNSGFLGQDFACVHHSHVPPQNCRAPLLWCELICMTFSEKVISSSPLRYQLSQIPSSYPRSPQRWSGWPRKRACSLRPLVLLSASHWTQRPDVPAGWPTILLFLGLDCSPPATSGKKLVSRQTWVPMRLLLACAGET